MPLTQDRVPWCGNRRKERLNIGMNDALQAILTQHPAFRSQFALLGLFAGYVTVPMIERISHLCRHEYAPSTGEAKGEDSWSLVLEIAWKGGVLERIEEDAFYVLETVAEDLDLEFHSRFREQVAELNHAFVLAYATFARRILFLRESNASRALYRLRPEESNVIYALHLARKHEQWPELLDLLRVAQWLYLPGRKAEWDRLLEECQSALSSSTTTTPAADSLKLWLLQTAADRAMAAISENAKGSTEAEANAERLLRQLEQELQRHHRPADVAQTALDLGTLLSNQQRWEEAALRHEQCIELARQLKLPRLEFKGLIGMARTDRMQGNLDRAEESAEFALKIAVLQECLHDRATALAELGAIAHRNMQPSRAACLFEEAFTICEQAGDDCETARVCLQLGNLANDAEDLTAAEEWFGRAARLFERCAEWKQTARVLIELGELAEERGLAGKASHYYRRCFSLGVRLNNSEFKTMALFHLGELAFDANNYDEASNCFSIGFIAAKRAGNVEYLATMSGGAGRAAYMQGDYDKAIILYKDALTFLPNLETLQAAKLYYNLGLAMERADRIREAVQMFQGSLDVSQKLQDKAGQIRCHAELIHGYWRLNQLQETSHHLHVIIALCKETGDERMLALVSYRHGRILSQNGNLQDAEFSFRRALDLYHAHDDVHGQLETLRALTLITPLKGPDIDDYYLRALGNAATKGDVWAQIEITQLLAHRARQNGSREEVEKWERQCYLMQKALGTESGKVPESLARNTEANANAKEANRLEASPAPKMPPPSAQATSASALSRAESELKLADSGDAQYWLQKALILAREESNRSNEARALRGLGILSLRNRDWETSEAWFYRSIDSAVSACALEEKALTEIAFGDLLVEAQQWRQALRLYQAAFRFFEWRKDHVNLAEINFRIARMAELRERPQEAIVHYRKALVLFEANGPMEKINAVREALDRLESGNELS